jgi:transcriptional regulator with XRE-family HTH domain
MSGVELRTRRIQAGLAGQLVCNKAGIARSRLSDLERGYLKPTADECKRINQAINVLIEAKNQVAQVAAQVGWPVAF